MAERRIPSSVATEFKSLRFPLHSLAEYVTLLTRIEAIEVTLIWRE